MSFAFILNACGGRTTGPVSVEAENPLQSESEEAIAEVTADPISTGPISIEIALEEGSASTATIGPEGGSLDPSDQNGTVYTLTIPEGALLSPEAITMTPITAATGEVIGDTFLAGISLEPENLHFLDLITIEISGESIESDSLGFGADGGVRIFI